MLLPKTRPICSVVSITASVVAAKSPASSRNQLPASTTSPYTVHSTNNSNSSATHHPADPRAFHLDPLYVAFPVAGGIILIVLIVFAVYILRRPPRNSAHCKYHQPPLGAPPAAISHNGLVRPEKSSFNCSHNVLMPAEKMALNGGHNSHVMAEAKVQNCGHNVFMRCEKSPPKVMAVEPFMARSLDRPYPDSERSSSGSESKLLAKV